MCSVSLISSHALLFIGKRPVAEAQILHPCLMLSILRQDISSQLPDCSIRVTDCSIRVANRSLIVTRSWKTYLLNTSKPLNWKSFNLNLNKVFSRLIKQLLKLSCCEISHLKLLSFRRYG